MRRIVLYVRNLKRIFGKIWGWMKEIPYLHCPECGGRMDSYYDPSTKVNVYVCRKCHKEWI